MSLEAIYKQYLNRPTNNHLAANAVINYIPSNVVIGEASVILKHYDAQFQVVKKKKEDIKSVVEGPSSLCCEIETTLQFSAGGGAYLPGIDASLLADRIVIMPIVHIVNFNSEHKIQQLRYYWDQASLLKSVEIIGRSGRNWPILHCSEHLRVVNASISAASNASQIPRRESRGGANGDKYTSLDLATYTETPRDLLSPRNPAPTESAKPAPREWNEIFANGEEPHLNDRSPSPTKRTHENSNTLKIGAGLHHQANRIFDDGKDTAKSGAFDRPLYKSDPKKYSHFAMGDGEDATTRGPSALSKPNTRNAMPSASFDFSDFNTPVKQPARKQAQQMRHFGIGVGESPEVAPTPQRHNMPARPDQAAQFHVDDKPSPLTNTINPNKNNVGGASRGKELESHFSVESIYTNDGKPHPLTNTVNPNKNNVGGASRGKELESHFSVESIYTNDENARGLAGNGGKKVEMEDRKQAVRQGLQHSFELFDDGTSKGKEEKTRGIKIHGNGMGNRSGTEWFF